MKYLKILFSKTFWTSAFLHFYYSYGVIKSAALTFYAFLTMIPITVLIISFISLFLQSNKEAIEWMLDNIHQFTPTGFDAIEEIVYTTVRISTTSTFIGFAGLIWSMLIFFGAMEIIFNQIWEVKKRRHFIVSKLVGISLMSILMLSTLLTFFLTNTILPLLNFELFPQFPGILMYIARIGLLSLSFFLIYKIIPAAKVGNISALFGAFFTTFAFELARVGYRLYIQQYPVRNVLYGSLLTAVVLLIWLNYTMIILVVGCQLSCTLQKKIDALHD